MVILTSESSEIMTAVISDFPGGRVAAVQSGTFWQPDARPVRMGLGKVLDRRMIRWEIAQLRDLKMVAAEDDSVWNLDAHFFGLPCLALNG